MQQGDPEHAMCEHAVSQGWLTLERLREVLLARELLRGAGRQSTLLALLAARHLRPEHARELEARFGRALGGSPFASVDPAPPGLFERATEAARRAPVEDPPVVQQALSSLAHLAHRATVSQDAPQVVPVPLRPQGRASGSASSLTPKRFGPYEVVRELGRGGMGAVFVAHHPKLDREVALKVVLGFDPGRLKRFAVEARTAARLRHPNIVAVHEVGEEQGTHFLVMDLIPGDSLAGKLEKTGPIEPREVARMGERLARALHVAHQAGVLHRDLKPANVLVQPDGQPMLTDFGLAKDQEGGDALTKTGQVLGTPSYMSPEQATGQKARIDARSDVYSLGATLYEALTGQVMFTGETAMNVVVAIVQQAPTPPSKLRAGIDRRLEAIVLRCLEKEPAARFESADALAEALAAWLAATEPGAVGRTGGGRGARAAQVAAVVLAVVALGLGAALLAARREADVATSLARARELEARGDATGARAALHDALARDAGRRDARVALARAHVAAGEVRAAGALAQADPAAFEAGPGLLVRGRLADLEGRGDEALVDYEAAARAGEDTAWLARPLALQRARAFEARGWTVAADEQRWAALALDPADPAPLADLVRGRLARDDVAGLARLWSEVHRRLGAPGEPALERQLRAAEASVVIDLASESPGRRLRAAIAAVHHDRPPVVAALRALADDPAVLGEAARATLLGQGQLVEPGRASDPSGADDLGRWVDRALAQPPAADGAWAAITILERARRLGPADRPALGRLVRDGRGTLLRAALSHALALGAAREDGLPVDVARGLLGALRADADPFVSRRARVAGDALEAVHGGARQGGLDLEALRAARALLPLGGVAATDGWRGALDALIARDPSPGAHLLRAAHALERGELERARAEAERARDLATGDAARSLEAAALLAGLAAAKDGRAAELVAAADADPAALVAARRCVTFAASYGLVALPGPDDTMRMVAALARDGRAARDGFDVTTFQAADRRDVLATTAGQINLRSRFSLASIGAATYVGQTQPPDKLWAWLDQTDSLELATGIRVEVFETARGSTCVAFDQQEARTELNGDRPLRGALAVELTRDRIAVDGDGRALLRRAPIARRRPGGGRLFVTWTVGHLARIVIDGRWDEALPPAPAPPDAAARRARLASLVPLDGGARVIAEHVAGAPGDLSGLRARGAVVEARGGWYGGERSASLVGVPGLRGDLELRARVRFSGGQGRGAGVCLRAHAPFGDVVWLSCHDEGQGGRWVSTDRQREVYWPSGIVQVPWTARADVVTLSIARLDDWVVVRCSQDGGPLEEVGPPQHFPFVGPVDALLFAGNYPGNVEPFTPGTFDQVDVLVPPARGGR